MNPPILSPFQLKERGWTPAMIRDLLGPYDCERDSELRVGSWDRLTDGIVKLYLEERVVQAETTAAFAVARDRARMRQDTAAKAAATRQARQNEQVAQHLAVPAPVLQPHPQADQRVVASIARKPLLRALMPFQSLFTWVGQDISESEGEVRTIDLTPNFAPCIASGIRSIPAREQKSSQYGCCANSTGLLDRPHLTSVISVIERTTLPS